MNSIYGEYSKKSRLRLDYTYEQKIDLNKTIFTLKLYAEKQANTGTHFNNYSNSTYTISGKTGSILVNGTGNYSWANNTDLLIAESTYEVVHDADGKASPTLSASWFTNLTSSSVVPNNLSVSGQVELPTIARISSVTCADGNIGSSTTINISRQSPYLKHTLEYTFGDLTGTIATKTEDISVGWTIPTSFYAKIPNAKSGTGTITCKTYYENTLIGSSNCTFNAFVVNSDPTITATVVDENATTIALTGNSNKIVKYFSKAKVTITATPKNSATITSRKVVCANKSASTAVSSLSNVESNVFNVGCADSRGNVGSAEITKTLVDYIRMHFTSFEIQRTSTTSKIITVSFSGIFFNSTFGAVANTLTGKWRYRKVGESWGAYTNITITKSSNNFNYSGTLGTNFNDRNDYEFEFVLTDKLMSLTKTDIVTAGRPIIDIGKNDVRVNGILYLSNENMLTWTNSTLAKIRIHIKRYQYTGTQIIPIILNITTSIYSSIDSIIPVACTANSTNVWGDVKGNLAETSISATFVNANESYVDIEFSSTGGCAIIKVPVGIELEVEAILA